MGLLNFWELIEDADFNEDRAVEVIRKCSTAEVFRQTLPLMLRSLYLAERHRGNRFDICARFTRTDQPFTVGKDRGYIVDACFYVKRRYSVKRGDPHMHEDRFQLLVTSNGQVVGGRPTTAST